MITELIKIPNSSKTISGDLTIVDIVVWISTDSSSGVGMTSWASIAYA